MVHAFANGETEAPRASFLLKIIYVVNGHLGIEGQAHPVPKLMHFSLYRAFPEMVTSGQNLEGSVGDCYAEREATTCVYARFRK